MFIKINLYIVLLFKDKIETHNIKNIYYIQMLCILKYISNKVETIFQKEKKIFSAYTLTRYWVLRYYIKNFEFNC